MAAGLGFQTPIVINPEDIKLEGSSVPEGSNLIARNIWRDKCACDITAKSCDAYCCCDTDCDQSILDVWRGDWDNYCAKNKIMTDTGAYECFDSNFFYQSGIKQAVERSTADTDSDIVYFTKKHPSGKEELCVHTASMRGKFTERPAYTAYAATIMVVGTDRSRDWVQKLKTDVADKNVKVEYYGGMFTAMDSIETFDKGISSSAALINAMRSKPDFVVVDLGLIDTILYRPDQAEGGAVAAVQTESGIQFTTWGDAVTDGFSDFVRNIGKVDSVLDVVTLTPAPINSAEAVTWNSYKYQPAGVEGVATAIYGLSSNVVDIAAAWGALTQEDLNTYYSDDKITFTDVGNDKIVAEVIAKLDEIAPSLDLVDETEVAPVNDTVTAPVEDTVTEPVDDGSVAPAIVEDTADGDSNPGGAV